MVNIFDITRFYLVKFCVNKSMNKTYQKKKDSYRWKEIYTNSQKLFVLYTNIFVTLDWNQAMAMEMKLFLCVCKLYNAYTKTDLRFLLVIISKVKVNLLQNEKVNVTTWFFWQWLWPAWLLFSVL